jgi:hypothetical protein
MSASVTVRQGSRVGYKRSPALHMAPCTMCRDDHQHQEPREAA